MTDQLKLPARLSPPPSPRPRPPPLSDEQAAVLAGIESWVAANPRRRDGRLPDRPRLTFGGYGGTGKTTLLMTLLTDERLKTTAVLSFTGKAVHVLRRKGLRSAQTVHSFLYKPETRGGTVVFKRKPPEAFKAVRLIVVDEAQTLNTELYGDLMLLGIPALFVGDMGQLEPIGPSPRLMAAPHLTLTTVHRQAAQSPIIRLGQSFREGDGSAEEVPGELEFGDETDAQDLLIEGKVDVAICGFNAPRHRLNAAARRARGFWQTYPQPGEQVVCLSNNHRVGVFNGLTAVVRSARPEPGGRIVMDLTADDGTELTEVLAAAGQFGRDKFDYAQTTNTLTYWDYGYALTAHKAMGSEWDRVAVVEQVHQDWDWRRWSYTAATRAAKYLFYAR